MITKPMLADTVEDLDSVVFPVLASPKLDGIRCLVLNREALSRKFKAIPNDFIRNKLSELCHDNIVFDGELTVGDTFHSSSSGVMTESGSPDFIYNVFDAISQDLNQSFARRYENLKNLVCNINSPNIRLVEHKLIESCDDLLRYEAECIQKGFEGIMLRKPEGRYKNGRSTLKEGLLLKVKQFSDFEAEIVGFEERLHNANEASLDELGHTKRSSHKDNMVPMNTLGSLILQTQEGIVFKCGTGFNDDLRKTIWENKHAYLGLKAKIKSQKAGEKDRPRFPVFLGIRHSDDM